jgi:hypothetical protein
MGLNKIGAIKAIENCRKFTKKCKKYRKDEMQKSKKYKKTAHFRLIIRNLQTESSNSRLRGCLKAEGSP